MPSRRRLNLFAFPPETNALFGMLVIASLILTLFLSRAFGIFFGIPGSIISANIAARGLEVTRAYLPVIGLSAAAVLAVLCMGFVFYLRHPSLIRRRRKIVPISDKDQEIQEQIN